MDLERVQKRVDKFEQQFATIQNPTQGTLNDLQVHLVSLSAPHGLPLASEVQLSGVRQHRSRFISMTVSTVLRERKASLQECKRGHLSSVFEAVAIPNLFVSEKAQTGQVSPLYEF